MALNFPVSTETSGYSRSFRRLINRTGLRASLVLDFLGGVLDPRVSFNRSTNATVTGPDGVLRWAPANMLVNTVNTGAVSGIVGSTASAPTGWLFGNVGGGVVFDATGGIQFTSAPGERPFITQNITCEENATYTLSALVVANPGAVIHIGFMVANLTSVPGASFVFSVNGSLGSSNYVPVPGDRIACIITCGGSNGVALARIGLGSNSGAEIGDISMRDFKVERGVFATPYVANTSTTVGYYAPRFDYDPANVTGYTYGPELLPNPTFDNDGVGWTPTAQSSLSNGAANVVSLDGTYQSVMGRGPITAAGATYQYSLEVKSITGALGFAIGDGVVTITAPGIYTGRLTTTIAVVSYPELKRNGGGQVVNAVVDNVSVKLVTPVYAPMGLMIEETRTNMLAYSAGMIGAQWAPISAATRGVASRAAPDGSFDAVTLTCSATGDVVRQQLSGVIAAGATYSISLYVRKAATGSATNIRITTNNTAAWSTGVSQQFPLTPEWKRVTVTGIVSNTASAYVMIGTLDAANVVDATCVGSADIWGAQLEAGLFATSYIPTFASAAQRNGESVVLDIPTILSASLTVAFEAEILQTISSYQEVLTIGDGTSVQNLTLSRYPGNNLRQEVKANTIQGAANTGGVCVPGGRFNIATRFAPNNVSTYRDGASAGPTDLDCAIPTSMSKIGIFSGYGRAGTLSTSTTGRVRRLTIYSAALTDAQLATLSSPSTSLQLDFMTGVVDARLDFRRATSGWYTNSLGITTQAGVNEPRFDYDPLTRNLMGLLIEEARTNFQTYSNLSVANGSYQVRGGFGIDLGFDLSVTAPDGTLGMRRVRVIAAQGPGDFLFRFGDVSNGTMSMQFSASLWVRTADGAAQAAAFMEVNDDGTNGTNATVGPTIQRITATGSSSSQPYRFADLMLPLGEYHIWGAQVELGSSSSSYIPTDASAVSRASDIASMPDAGWFQDAAGAFVVESLVAAEYGSTTWPHIINVDDGTAATNYFRPAVQVGKGAQNSAFFEARVAGTVQPSVGQVTVAGKTTPIKMAFAYDYLGSTRKQAVNGSATTSVAAGTQPAAGVLTTLRLGSLSQGHARHIRKIAYYPVTLPDATLQTLSTL